MRVNRPSTSLWMGTCAPPDFRPLDDDVYCDVAVIGGGIAGMSTAYMMARRGAHVVVVDDGEIANGETVRTTAQISTVLDVRYDELEKIHGAEKTIKIASSQYAAINMIEEIVRSEKISCDFKRVDGYLFLGEGSSRDELEKELEAMHRAGLSDATLLEFTPLTDRPLPCIRVGQQAQFHVTKYIQGLGNAVLQMGGRIYCHTHVSQIVDGHPAKLVTDLGNRIHAREVVVTTNSPVSNVVAIHTKMAAYRSYVIAAEIDREAIPQALYWDTEDPYHYIRTSFIGEKEYVLIGGGDHKTGQATDFEVRYLELEKWARELMPAMGNVEFRWSGQIYEPVDGLAYIGRDPNHAPNINVATGFSGVGMTQGTLAGKIISDLILRSPNEWVELYEPTRKSLLATADYLKENLNSAAQYVDYLKGAEAESPADIDLGEGAIVIHDGHKLAVYRDEEGRVFQCNAICPHLKGIVCWNSSEKSWDCPAHGSRFSAVGTVIDGPANENLEATQYDLDENEAAIRSGETSPGIVPGLIPPPEALPGI